jgi:hypothetical protein
MLWLVTLLKKCLHPISEDLERGGVFLHFIIKNRMTPSYNENKMRTLHECQVFQEIVIEHKNQMGRRHTKNINNASPMVVHLQPS